MPSDNSNDRSPYRREQRLTPTAYRTSLSVSYGLWSVVVLWFAFEGEFHFHFKRDDFLSLIQTSGGLAAVALAILAYLHATDSVERYLKLIAAAVTVLFLITSFTGLLTAMLLQQDPGLQD